MTTLNISLPDEMKRFVECQVAQGGYSTSSEYLRELIRQDQKRRAQEKLEAKLIEGLRSGAATEMKRKDWDEIRQQILKRHTKRTGK